MSSLEGIAKKNKIDLNLIDNIVIQGNAYQ